MDRSIKGFNLFELMIALAIIATLSLIAVPNLSDLVAHNRVIIHANKVLETLYMARSLAISQQQTIHLCALSPPQNCATKRDFNANWSKGWLIFADLNNNNLLDTEDKLLRQIENSTPLNIVFNQRGRLRFFPNGSARSAGFYICDHRQKYYRHVYLLHSGRARISKQVSDKRKQICDSV